MPDLELYDKICNVRLIDADGNSTYIDTPDEGFKQDIQVSGHFIPSPLAQDISVRITNFYPEKDLRSYKAIELTIGYKDTNMQEVINGQVWIAYKESPGPDGVTLFQVKLGSFTKFINQKFQKNYEKNTPIIQILTDIGTTIELPFDTMSFLTAADVIDVPMYFNGFAKDAIMELQSYCQQKFKGLVIFMDNNNLTAFSQENGLQKTWNIDYFSSVPRREAYGWTFVAPWIPGLRPGHYVNINSAYAKQTYSTYINQDISASGSMKALVQDVQFDFRTTSNTNQMTCLVLDQFDQTGSQ